jgi:hypothetical protein
LQPAPRGLAVPVLADRLQTTSQMLPPTTSAILRFSGADAVKAESHRSAVSFSAHSVDRYGGGGSDHYASAPVLPLAPRASARYDLPQAAGLQVPRAPPLVLVRSPQPPLTSSRAPLATYRSSSSGAMPLAAAAAAAPAQQARGAPLPLATSRVDQLLMRYPTARG